ncbi:MAG: hypothetical protein LM522_01500 [Candidatus Contendobacter sp.]|nr:hypothetical protein [Candidatus Contendobacter sp.]
MEFYARTYGFGEDLTDLTPEQIQSMRSEAQSLDEKAVRKQWDRVAAPLQKTGLYQSGCVAVGAVRKLGLKKPTLAMYQTLYRQAYVDLLRLHLAAAKVPSDWQTHTGNIEGRSAELGLALALLLAATQASHRLVIATGRLGGQPTATRPEDPDVEVLSVGKLPEKLRLVEQLAKTRNLPRGQDHTDPVWLFTPTTSENGGEWVAVETLSEVARLKNLGITVIPVKTLKEAAGHLKAERARWMWQDSAWLGGIACLLLILGAIIYGLTRPPTPLLPKTPPKLEITVGDRNNWSEGSKPLQNVRLVYPGQTLGLIFSHHEGEFRYLLNLYSDGKADIEDIEANFKVGGEWKDSAPDRGFIDVKDEEPNTSVSTASTLSVVPIYWTFLLLVSDQPWEETQRRNLASRISSALNSKIKLPPSVQYRFETKGCEPVSIKVDFGVSGPYSFRGPVAESALPPTDAICADWAKQLLEILNHQTQGKVRLSGYAFQVAPY